MGDKNSVSFVLKAQVRGAEVTPGNIPLPLFNAYNQQVEQLIMGSERKNAINDPITAKIEEGSYKLIVALPVLLLASLKADLDKIDSATQTMDGVDPKRASVVEEWQESANRDPLISYEVVPAWDKKHTLKISSKTSYKKKAHTPVWVAVEKYLVGTITNMGGSSSPNVHLRHDDTGKTHILSASQDFIARIEENALYRRYRVRAVAEENLNSGELRNLTILELGKPFQPSYDEAELNALILQATPRWKDVPDTNAWLHDLRGGDDA